MFFARIRSTSTAAALLPPPFSAAPALSDLSALPALPALSALSALSTRPALAGFSICAASKSIPLRDTMTSARSTVRSTRFSEMSESRSGYTAIDLAVMAPPPTSRPCTVKCGNGNNARRISPILSGAPRRFEASSSMRGIHALAGTSHGTATSTMIKMSAIAPKIFVRFPMPASSFMSLA